MRTTTETTYSIVTKHPTGYRDGTHEVTVIHSEPAGTRYVVGEGFGCSRDYRTVSDQGAIECLLSEHMMILRKIRKVRQRSY